MRTSRCATICNTATVRIVGLLVGLALIPVVGMAQTAVSDCLYALNGKMSLGAPQCITEESDDSDGDAGVLKVVLSIGHVGGLNWTVLPAYLKDKADNSFSDSIDASVVIGSFISDKITVTMLSGGPAPAGYSAAKALAETGGWINVTSNLFPLLDTNLSHLTIWAYSDTESAHVMPLPLPVPEPDSRILFLTGLAGLAVFGQSRRRSKPD